MFRRTICTAALGLGLLMGPTVPATAACEGDGCSATANAKPLNIMQFMREQAASTRVRNPSASTRVAKPRPSYTQATAKVPQAPHRAIAARKKPAPVPVEAAASFASRPEQDTQPPAISSPYNPFNPFDDLANAAPAETTGAAIVGGPNVQLVDAEELNDIDRKADSAPALSTNSAPGDGRQTHSEKANTSWLRWIWSALGSTFTALATAVHQLVRVIV
jgi:hypothetical protein